MDVLSRMTLEQKVGQVFMLGFEGLDLNPSNRALVHDLHLGGVTLFARNVDDARQVAKLTAALQTIADPVPLFVSADQEGGLVVRVTRGATVFPGNMALGATGDLVLAERVATGQAVELRAMGINMNLGPVVDVNTNPQNPVIGVRSFGSQTNLVQRFGAAAVRTLQAGGVSAVAKHFPGHGDTAADSHFELPIMPHPLSRLESVELPPFQAAMQAGVDAVMTAHVYVPAVEPRADLPSTLSRAVLTGLLRERLGFQGLILTDALDMGAIKQGRGVPEAAVDAFEAGADMLLIAGITAEDRAHLGEGPPALLAAVESGRVSEARLDASVLRVLEAKARRGLLDGPSSAPMLTPEVLSQHGELALDAARRAVTLLRSNRPDVLPLRAEQRVLVVQPNDPTGALGEEGNVNMGLDSGPAASLAQALRSRVASVDEWLVPSNPPPDVVRQAGTRARTVDVVIFASYDLALHPAQAELAQAIAASGVPVVGAALRGPYDAEAAPAVPIYLGVYGDRPVHLQAAVDALVGAITPSGRAP